MRGTSLHMSFGNKWIKSHTENVGDRLLEGLKPQAPLKPRIEEAQNRLHLQISKLDGISIKMHEKDQLIFKRIVHSLQNHDSHYAKVLSSELSQVRKMKQKAISAKLGTPSDSGLNEDTMKIIEEASVIVEESMKDKFPDLPSTTMQTSKTETSLL